MDFTVDGQQILSVQEARVAMTELSNPSVRARTNAILQKLGGSSSTNM
jgi:hypothetical protein